MKLDPAFDAWIDLWHWKDRDPLHADWKIFYKHGADHRYLNFLTYCLTIGDQFKVGRREIKDKLDRQEKRRKANQSDNFKAGFDEFLRLYRLHIVESTVLALQRQGFISPSAPPDLLPSSDDTPIPDLIASFYALAIESLDVDREEERLEEQQAMEESNRNAPPLFRVYREYHSLSGKQDSWGSFFMLALTEHIRETGGGNRVDYLAASRFMKRIRSVTKTSAENGTPGVAVKNRKSATERVRQLRKQFDWQCHLKLIKEHFENSTFSNSATPSYLRQFLSELYRNGQ